MTDLITALIPSFERTLRARRRSPKTIRSYTDSARLFATHLASCGRPLEVGSVTRADVEGFVIAQLEAHTASTAASRYRYLQQFWRWCVDEGEIAVSPMAGMSPPAPRDKVVPVLSETDLKALLAACDGTGFTNRRDAAIVWTFVATGARLGEVAALGLDDVDFSEAVIRVVGKGDRERWVPFGDKTALALDRYERERRRHPRAARSELWLGAKGALGDSGIYQMLERRAQAAGIAGVHPHQFRHTFAHRWLDSGGTEGDLMAIAGWRSAQMLGRYAASARAARAQRAYRRMDLEGDL